MQRDRHSAGSLIRHTSCAAAGLLAVAFLAADVPLVVGLLAGALLILQTGSPAILQAGTIAILRTGSTAVLRTGSAARQARADRAPFLIQGRPAEPAKVIAITCVAASVQLKNSELYA